AKTLQQRDKIGLPCLLFLSVGKMNILGHIDAPYELLCFIMEYYIYLTSILTGVIIFVIVGR
ncbi:MAG: hypothetical protein ACI4F7_00215, partial [Acutalibacteraceae bacterium]